MAATRYVGNRFREGRRGLSLIEYGLALSVIVGFGFVTVRVMNTGLPGAANPAASSGTEIVKIDAPPLAAAAADAGNP